MSNDLIVHTTDATFDADVLQSTMPVVVDFWAEWCGPCRMIAPVLDELAEQYQGRVQFVKLNTQDNQAVPASFGIRGIPTLMFFKNGQLQDTQVGVRGNPRVSLKEWIDAQLA